MSLLSKYASPEKAKELAKFFQVRVGGYGEGDTILGVSVPDIRLVAHENKHLKLSEIENLMTSKIHEERLLALWILVYQFAKADVDGQKLILDFYLGHTEYINNWDLVDSSAHKILGAWLVEHEEDLELLQKLASSRNMWEQRIAIIATFPFIKQNKFAPSFDLIEILLDHPHDLMHKAVGWTLREIWKKNPEIVENFIQKNYRQIPRTTLRYAIERMEETKRKSFLAGW
jgi:3-methyladenine DNA glycosylase AlkD